MVEPMFSPTPLTVKFAMRNNSRSLAWLSALSDEDGCCCGLARGAAFFALGCGAPFAFDVLVGRFVIGLVPVQAFGWGFLLHEYQNTFERCLCRLPSKT